MFIQVIRGKAKDADALRAQADRWMTELGPGAKGFLGATEGIADDGTFVTVARFESEEAARANSDRPEQGAWWEETSKTLENVTFYDCPTTEVFMGGGSDDAGFVQLMIYKPKDVEAMKKLNKEFEQLGPQRPDVIGGTSAIATDGTFIDTNYFTSEKEAREGEKKDMPADVQGLFERFNEAAGNVEFIDLRDPWLFSP